MNKKAKIVIIGAGSAIFTKTILCDLLHFDDIDVENISLVDINEEKLQVVKKMTEKMLSPGRLEYKSRGSSELGRCSFGS